MGRLRGALPDKETFLMSDTRITRRNLAIRTGAIALTGLLPTWPRAQEDVPVVYYAREATPEAFIAIFDKLREDLGAAGRRGLVGRRFTATKSTRTERSGRRSRNTFREAATSNATGPRATRRGAARPKATLTRSSRAAFRASRSTFSIEKRNTRPCLRKKAAG